MQNEDPLIIKLLNFYRAYRAVVRAKVAIFTYNSLSSNNPLRGGKLAEFHRLVDMAIIYSRASFHLTPLNFCGMIATGKSKHSKYFSRKFPVIRLASDELRKNLAGMPPEKSSVVPAFQGIYSEEVSIKVYTELGRLAAELLKCGRTPVVEATFIKKTFRDAFDIHCKGGFFITFTAKDDIIKTRLEKRKGGVSDGRLSHFNELKAASYELPDYNRIDTSLNESDEAVLEKILCLIMKSDS
jgi:predicted kinase